MNEVNCTVCSHMLAVIFSLLPFAGEGLGMRWRVIGVNGKKEG